MDKLVLASTSIYRKELLTRLAVDFQCQKPDFDEAPFKRNWSGTNTDLCQNLALKKAKSLDIPDACIIGSDQIASLNGKILDKPGSFEAALLQLQQLQNCQHELITAVAVCHKNQIYQFYDISKLRMLPLKQNEIENYLHLDEPFDCAGSYKIERHGIALFSEILCQDFTAIQGLPLIELSQVLRKIGYPIPGEKK